MRFNVGYSANTTEHKIYIQQVPNIIAWLSNFYDFVDEMLGCRMCDTRLRLWLYRWEDKKSKRFYIDANAEELKRFYEFMKWESDEQDN